MSEWKKVKLGDVCERVTSGGTPKANITSYYNPPTVPWLKTKEVNYCRITETENYISEEGLANSSAKLIAPNSVIIAMYGQGDTAGRVAINKIPLTTNQACCNLTIDESKADYEFIYYQLCTLYNKMVSLKAGAAQPNLNTQIIKNLEVLLPSLSTQHRIATILSRYDSLIENYQKQIKLLEEAAQRLYKEWFVDLHFPGHENTKIVNGVPEGWEKKPALDFFEMSIGKTPPRAQKQWFTKGNNGIPWVSISDMKETMFVQETAEELTQDACENYNIKVVPRGTILLSFKLTVGRVAFAGADVCTNEAIAHFQKEGDEWKAYTLMYLRNYNYDSLGNTSGISKAVNSTIIKNMPFVMPCTSILQEFSQRVLPFIKQTENLQSQIRLLTEARDRWLPKLMGGEITV